ncbi:MAG: serine O-acetyltransferase [Candidatus Omnitrophica bacterium]|nr:serine O-acetyltransferase [Candidatus Omnitrophota bacterium]MBU1924626.1 serine O-acetyltransferase [Candidatus Omnitrophota bacterium]MBU2063902.1 serine O-acetyltransferase [Candidatus Omnitrophota bacterium]
MVIFVTLVLLFIFVSVVFKNEINSARQQDPAATNNIEILLTYSGVHALILHRIAHRLWRMRILFFPRWLSQFNRWLTGIEIHPAAKIGHGLFIDHGMGVVIGETTVIADNVTLYQGVTLGGTGKEKGKRHPNIGSNVVIGAGAKVLGNITIGDNSYIGANAVVIKDVPADSTVVGVPGRITKQDGKKIETELDHIHVLDPLMQMMDDLKRRIEELEEEKGKK